MNPTRRALLKGSALAATAALAGCIADDVRSGRPERAGSTATPGGSPTPTTTPASDDAPLLGADGPNGSNASGETRLRGTGGPGLVVAGTDAQDGPVEHRIEVLREAASADAPPRVRVSVTNGGETPVQVGEARAVVFAYRQDTDEQLILLPAGGEYPAAADCWRLTDSIAVTEEYRTATLDAGETLRSDLDLYATPGEDACLPVGEFRFETGYDVAAADEGLGSDGATARTWGFSVLLE